MAHREGVPRTRPGNLRTACLPTRCRMLSGGPPAPLGWAGSENPGVRPLFKKGLPHASSNAVGWPEMAHREGVPRTRPRNEGISGAWQKRFVQETASLLLGRALFRRSLGQASRKEASPNGSSRGGPQAEAWKSRFSVFLRVRGPSGQPASPRVVECCRES